MKERSGPPPERRRRLRDHPYVGVLRNPHLRRLYLGIFVSSIGDGVAAVTVPWLALEVAGTVNRAFAVAAAATLAFLPGIPLSLVAGLRRWRIPPRTMLVVDSVFRGALFTLMGVLAVTHRLALGPYLIILAVSSLTRTLVAGARRTAIDQLIRPEQRLAANSLLGTCFQLGQDVLGPAAGGLLIAGPGPGVAMLADSLTLPTKRRPRRTPLAAARGTARPRAPAPPAAPNTRPSPLYVRGRGSARPRDMPTATPLTEGDIRATHLPLHPLDSAEGNPSTRVR